LKGAVANGIIYKYWITGVLPVFREWYSPLLCTYTISGVPGYNGICGFTDIEVRQIVQTYLSSHEGLAVDNVMKQLKDWYGGYKFYIGDNSNNGVETLYNPFLVFKHLRGLTHKYTWPPLMEEVTFLHTRKLLGAITDNGEASFLQSWLETISGEVHESTPHFMVEGTQKRDEDPSIIHSLLYYFGITTYDGYYLKVPNKIMIYTVCTISTWIQIFSHFTVGHA
jgi:hypothetical protein